LLRSRLTWRSRATGGHKPDWFGHKTELLARAIRRG
jgi:hypothetical protein